MERIAVRLVIRGRVQGVGYRAWASAEASRLGLDGWVRNRRDGTVELVAAGPAARIDQLEAACRRGPPSAEVTEIERTAARADGLSGFQIRPTV